MGATFSLLLAAGSFFLTVGLVLATIIINAVLLPFVILLAVFETFRDIFLNAYMFIKDNKWLCAGLAAFLVITFAVGPFGVTHTSIFIEAINVVYSCFVRPLWELYNKVVVYAMARLYEQVVPDYNLALIFIYNRGVIAYDGVKSVVDCVAMNGNYQVVFDVPIQIWQLVGPLGFAFLAAPRQDRDEPFLTGTYGYWFPRDNSLPQSIKRFEFDPIFQSLGATPSTPSSGWPNIGYTVRDIWVQVSQIFFDAGSLVFDVISDLSRPAQRFFPSLYIDVTTENSLWRKASDLLCRVLGFTYYTFLYPFNSPADPSQPIRDVIENYQCPTLRAFAGFLQVAMLLVNDFLSWNRPLPDSPLNCPNPPSIATLLQGVPIVDFFVGVPEMNLNIFRSNAVFCDFNANLMGQTCDGIAYGAYSFIVTPSLVICPEWTGAAVPLPFERINYLKLIVRRVARLVSVFVNFNQDPILELKITGGADLAAEILNFFIDDLLYVFNAIARPIQCNIAATMSYWLGTKFIDLIIHILEFAYSDSCAAAIVSPASQRNIFLCIVALGSRADSSSFWHGFCALIEGIASFAPAFGDLHLNCDARRKRDLGEARHRIPGLSAPTYWQKARLWTSYFAHETRDALPVFEKCLFDANSSKLLAPQCNSTCAILPCFSAAVECIRDDLPQENYWHGALSNTAYIHSALRISAVLSDTAAGCENSEANILMHALNATAQALRSVAAQTAVASAYYGAAHSECKRVSDNNSTVYLECVGLSPLGDTWEETLELNEIPYSGVCGSLLHRRGIVLDEGEFDRTYEGCLTMFAFGARARAMNTTLEPLHSFIDGWGVTHAMFRSTEDIYAESQELQDGLVLFGARNSSWWSDLINSDLWKASKTIHEAAAIAYAYLQYQADVYEHIVIAPTSGHEKDQKDEELFRKRVLSVALAMAIQPESLKKTQVELASKIATAPDVGSIWRAYGHSLYWVDQLYNSANNQINEDADLYLHDAPNGSLALVEFSVRQRYSTVTGGRGATPQRPRIGMRLLNDAGVSIAMRNDSLVGATVDPFVEIDMDTIMHALESYGARARSRRSAALTAQAAAGLRSLRQLDATISAASQSGDALAHFAGRTTAAVSRLMMRVIWNLANSRLRLQSLPVSQGAYVIIDALANGASEDVVAWLAGDRSYIIGVGYVDNSQYEEYMSIEGRTRRTLSAGFFSPLRSEEVEYSKTLSSSSMLARFRRAYFRPYLRREWERNGAEGDTFALPGDTAYSRYVENYRRRVRDRLSFRHRASFLIQHNLHGDEHAHVTVPEVWMHYDAASTANTSELRRHFSALAATDFENNDFFIEVLDVGIATAGGPSDVIKSFFDMAAASAETFFLNFFATIGQKITDFFNDLVAAGTCQGINDYGLAGTGTYKFGCLPFLGERLFSWFRFFPSQILTVEPFDNAFSAFVGTGDLAWPSAMLKTDCATPRHTAITFVNPTTTFYEDIVGFWVALRISNVCVSLNAPAIAERPLCTFLSCDYCPREFFNADEQGFTSGWVNISVWSALFRKIIEWTFGAIAKRAFWFVFVLFLALEFPALLPLTGQVFTYAAVALTFFGTLYIEQRPDRFLLPFLLLYLFRFVGVGISWLIWIGFLVNLSPMVFSGAASPLLPGSFLATASRVISPDQLLIWALQGVRLLNPFLSWLVDIPAAVDPVISILSVRLPPVLTTIAEVEYSFFSYYLPVLLIVGAIGIFILFYFAYRISIAVFQFIALTVSQLGLIVSGGVALFASYRLFALRTAEADLEDDVDSMQKRMQNLQAELRRRQQRTKQQ